MRKVFLLCFVLVLFLVGCSSNSTTISYVQAKEKIINEGAILIDVRTQEEYDTSHIDGASLLTLDNITEDTVTSIVDNKNKPIIVYCQSGKRSAQALNILKNLGYKEVYDLGAMSNWKE